MKIYQKNFLIYLEMKKKNLFKDLDLLLSNFIEKEKKRKENIKKKDSIWSLTNFHIENVDYDFNKRFHECFFNLNTKLLPNYSQYLNTDFYNSNSVPCLENLFKVDKYLSSIPSY